jgi:hypothetical protein
LSFDILDKKRKKKKVQEYKISHPVSATINQEKGQLKHLGAFLDIVVLLPPGSFKVKT